MKTEVTVVVYKLEDKFIVEFTSPWLDEKEVYDAFTVKDVEFLTGRIIASLSCFDA